MSNRHRPAPAVAPRWRTALLRAVSLIVVLAVGAGVYLGVKREERQGCLNDAFRASLEERSRSTDGLLEALAVLNAELVEAETPREEANARRTFGEAVARVKADRVAARATTDAKEPDCG